MEQVRPSSVARRPKLVVGIDYGTTFSGLAFALSNITDIKEIRTFTAWPGAPAEYHQHFEKAPSVFAYAKENEELDSDAWGYEVDAGLISYSWTKLLLDSRSIPSLDDDPGLQEALSSELMALPPNKSATDVVRDYLAKMYTMFWSHMLQIFGGPELLDLTPIEYWLTVPAIWGEAAKLATRNAAKAAGFGTREIDEINLITEPEAAAELALKDSVKQTSSLVKANTGVIVCDCGGGTVDMTSYTIKKTEPVLVLDEPGIGRGGKCGGTYIDRNLYALLTERYGAAFSSLPASRIGPGSQFMKAFETKKQNFNLNNTRKTLRLPLKLCPSENQRDLVGYDSRWDEIVISEKDMLGCFEPVVEKILGLLQEQISSVQTSREPAVKTIVLVGGLGSSPYIRERLSRWCSERQVRMVSPWCGPWSAVVNGAVLRGLGGVKVNKRRMRQHFGCETERRYNPKEPYLGPQKHWDERWMNPFTGNLMIPGYVNWLIRKNTVFEETTEVGLDVNLYSRGRSMEWCVNLCVCDMDEAPESVDHDRVEKVGVIVSSFNDLDLSRYPSTLDGQGTRVWKIKAMMYIKFGSRDGTLKFRACIEGKDVGTAEIEFANT